MIGTKLSDRYEITGELGRGGMGVVFRAWDPVLDREVAVKLIPPTHVSPESEERFEREAKLVAQMDHPAIVPIYDFGRHGESLFLVMPVVPGTSLRPFLRDKSLLLGDVVDLGIQVADALAYSHAREVIHRDIKPENIMISREETGETRIRVMDFGLARMSTKTRITQTGMLVGTMGYVSPEQVLSKETDHRSDLYSLGTVLYESLVGSSPFSGEVQSILYRIVHEAPQPPTALGVDIDPELEEIVLSCLAKDPARRPQTAKELSDSLRGYLARLRDSDRRRSVMVSSTGQIPRTTLAPFVGREKELTELQQRLNAAIAGECQFVIVGGEPGSGKTRLLDELENLAKARSIRVLHGRFVEQDRSFPYQGFCEVIQEYFRQKETSTASSGLPDFSDVASELVSLFPMLSEITEFRSSSSAGTDRATPRPEDRTQIFELLARTLTKMAGGKSLLLLLEDLHDAEVSLEALQYIVRRLGPTPTLIVGTYRTLDVDRRHPLTKMLAGFHGDRKHASLTLGPFSPSEHRRFLETLIGGPELASDLVEKLYEGAEGNPFFTKELVRSLLDSGAIDQDDTGSWSLTGEAAITTDELPATIQQAVENRIERLPEELRDILSVAAVIGRSFDYRDLEALTGDGDVDDAVDRLVQEGLIEEDRKSRGDRLSFCSGVVRDVLYAQLSRRKRRVLHRRCGEQIEKRQSGKLERVYPELLYHFSEGDEPEKSVEYGLQLARKSLDRFTPEDGVRAAKTALEFLDEEWEGEGSTEGEVRLVLAQAHRMAGDIDAALNQADTAIRIFEREHQETRVVDALVFAAETAWQARRPAETSRWVERGTKAARAADRRASLRELLSLGATLANLRGEYENANELLREVEQLGEAARESAPSDEITEGGELVVAMANPVEARDPAFIEVVEATEVLSNVFETLVATDEQGSLVPALCERWQGVDDGRRFLLSLRPGVHFQDGHPLTAESVKASFERTIRHVTRETPAAYAAIVGVEAFLRGDSSEVAGLVVRSERELEIQLREALQIYPAFLTDMYTGISRASPEDPAQVTGTGPFRIAERSGERVLLQRNERYWKGTRSVLDSIEFRTGMSASAIAEGYRSGQLDLARDLLPQDLESFLRDPRYREGFVETPQKNTYFILYNCRSGSCTQDPKLRHALSGVVRVHDLVWRTLGRFAQPAASLIPPGVLGHDPGRKRYPLTL
ncbi:MAG: BREX system ATP-binding domain-containing protein, partial [Planctomycetota bacterium]